MNNKTKEFEFNAPQFLDFTSTAITEDDGADSYFDTDHEDDRRLTQIFQVTSTSQGNSICPSSSRTKNGAASPENEVLDLSHRSIDLSNVDRLQHTLNIAVQQPPASARKIKPAYAPEIKMTEVNGEMEQAIVMVEVPYQGLRVHKHKRCTKIEPFSFEERDRQLQRLKEEKIKKILEEEKKMAEFHAKPVPNFSHGPVNFSTTQSVTDPIAFEFRTDRRLEERHKREKLCDDKEEKYQFKAKPADVLHKPPFEPKKADVTALTDVTGFHLNTEERARKREEFNTKLKEKEATLEMIRSQRRHKEEQELLADIKRLRKEAEHKANPVPRKIIEQPFKVLPSSVPLTEPKTPTVLSRKRKHE